MLKFVINKKNRYFMRLWWAQLISQFGDRLNQMALIGLVVERAAGSPTTLAKLLSFTIIPVFIIGPIAGVLVDRWDDRRTLMWCDLFRGALVLLIPLALMHRDSLVPIYLVVFLVFCFSRFHVPAKMSIIPDLVEREQLLMANSMITTTGMIAFVAGAAIGGWLVEALGARAGFLGDAATYFLSGAIIVSIHRDFRLHVDRKRWLEQGREILRLEKSVWHEMLDSIRYLAAKKELRFVLSMIFIVLAAAGAVYVVIIVFIQQAFHTVTRDLGILAICLGAGLFGGVLAYGRYGKTIPWYRTMFLCLIAGGIMIIAFTLAVSRFPSLILGGVLAAVMGFVIAPVFIATNTVIHQICDERMRGKIFTALEMVIHFAFLVAMLISSYLAQIIPPSLILGGVGALFGLVGAVGLVRYRHGNGLAAGGDHMAY